MDAIELDLVLDDIIIEVCKLAELVEKPEWPAEIRTLLGAARKVQTKFGLHYI